MRCTAVILLLTFASALGAQDAMIFAPGAKLKIEAEGDGAGEGPAWHPKLGVFTSGQNGHIHRLDRAGKSSIFRKNAGTNGLLFDTQGRLVACESAARRITRTELDGTVKVLTDNYQGKRYNSPNDLTIDSKGRIYFSDPRYGKRDDMQIRDDMGNTIEGVYRIDPDGKVTRIIGRELERPNGVLVSADDKYLFVADNNNDTLGGARQLLRFDLKADGTVDFASKKRLHDWGNGRGPDGVKQDREGRLYVAGGLNKPNPPFEPANDVKGGIYVISPEGKLLSFLAVPRDEVTNCAFGGDDLKTLYITGGGTLYSIRTKASGRVLWPNDAKLPNPPEPGTFKLNITSAGFERVVHVHVPKGYKLDTRPALVLMLHGAGGNGAGVLEKDGWIAKADKEGFIAVAPDGLPAQPKSPADFKTNPALWNSGQLKRGSPRAAIDDVAFIRQLLDDLKEKLPHDENRVFCTGHSNGGGMTFRLATELSERFKAVGMVAGLMAMENPMPNRPLPTLFILGTKDPLMPVQGGEVKLPWGTGKKPPVAEPLAAWAKALGCEPEPKTLSDKDGLKMVEYLSKRNGPTLKVLYIEGHGHQWPGAAKGSLPESMIGPITNKLNATDTIWEFFKASSK
jgi:gluconolactonase